MKTRIMILLVVTLAVGLAIFVVNNATAYNLDGVCDDSELAAGECAVTASGWVMEIVRGTGIHDGEFPVICDGEDTSKWCIDRSSGTSIKGYGFSYLITAPQYEATLSQANLLVPDCGEGNRISITYPTDNSVTILPEDPNTKYGAGSSDYVIIWDSLSNGPSKRSDIRVWITKAGAGLKGAMMNTDTANEYIEKILGPECCAETQVPSEVKVEFLTGCSGTPSVETLVAEYDQCTGDAKGVYLSNDSGEKEYFYPIKAYICEGNELEYDLNSCITIKTIGPREGAVVFAGYQYFGYGSQIYRGPATDPTCLTNSNCPEDADPGAPFKPSKTLDGKTVFEFDRCGYLSDVTDPEGHSYARVTPWICEAAENGKVDGKRCSRILGGAIDGAIIYANPTYCIGGQLITTANCTVRADCPYGQKCVSGSCYCRSNDECASGSVCKLILGSYGVCKVKK